MNFLINVSNINYPLWEKPPLLKLGYRPQRLKVKELRRVGGN